MKTEEKLSKEQCEKFLKTLKDRFEKNTYRNKELEWIKIQERLENNSEKLLSLYEMERTGGEPDIVEFNKKTEEYIFYDCSTESPHGRRSLCYDHEALASRKKHKPKNNVLDVAASIGIELLTENEYRKLQEFKKVDTKTSSWIKTPTDIRKLGGALFCDRRYNHVFVYHNSAESYYASRGFRGSLRV